MQRQYNKEAKRREREKERKKPGNMVNINK